MNKGLPFENVREKRLRQILRVMRRITAPTHIRIKRIPIRGTKFGQGILCACGIRLPGPQHNGPMGCRENRLPADGIGGCSRVSCLSGAHGLSLNRISKNCKPVNAAWSSPIVPICIRPTGPICPIFAISASLQHFNPLILQRHEFSLTTTVLFINYVHARDC